MVELTIKGQLHDLKSGKQLKRVSKGMAGRNEEPDKSCDG
jgi:hypothetical protein